MVFVLILFPFAFWLLVAWMVTFAILAHVIGWFALVVISAMLLRDFLRALEAGYRQILMPKPLPIAAITPDAYVLRDVNGSGAEIVITRTH